MTAHDRDSLARLETHLRSRVATQLSNSDNAYVVVDKPKPKQKTVVGEASCPSLGQKFHPLARLRQLVPGLGGILPNRLRTKLLYSQDGVTTTGAGGGVSNLQFACNSVYDPFVSAGGHQPMGFDQLIQLYQFCRVYACTIRATAFAGSGGTGNQPAFGIQLTENSSFSPTDLETIIERGNCVWRAVPVRAANNGNTSVTIRWEGAKWWSKIQVEDQSNNNTASAGPTGELAYANVFAIQPGGGSFDDFYIQVEIVYDVEFFGQLQTNPS